MELSRDFGEWAVSATPLSGVRRWACLRVGAGTIGSMADAASLDERLEQIGTQLDWVRDYL